MRHCRWCNSGRGDRRRFASIKSKLRRRVYDQSERRGRTPFSSKAPVGLVPAANRAGNYVLARCVGLSFAAKLRQHVAPGFSLGWEAKTRSISRETATAMFLQRDQHIAVAVSRLNVHFKTYSPRLKPGATRCRLYEAKSER